MQWGFVRCCDHHASLPVQMEYAAIHNSFKRLSPSPDAVVGIQKQCDDLIASVRSGILRSGLVLCSPLSASDCDYSMAAYRSLRGLQEQSIHTRALTLNFNLLESLPSALFPSHPLHLQISMTQARARDQPGREEAEGRIACMLWPAGLLVQDADALAVVRTLIVPMSLSFAPDVVFFNVTFAPSLSPAAYARTTRALMVLAHGRVIVHATVNHGNAHDSACLAACIAALEGEDVPALPHQDLMCSPTTVALLEQVIAPLTPAWPCLSNTISFRLLSEHQFFTVQGDDTVTATVALACLSMTSVREEDEDTLVDGNRKRALSESVTGGAAALLKVRNSCSSPPCSP